MDDALARRKANHNTTVAMITGDGDTYWEVGHEGQIIRAETALGAQMVANGFIEADFMKLRRLP